MSWELSIIIMILLNSATVKYVLLRSYPLMGEVEGTRSLLEFSSQFAENRVKLSLAPKLKISLSEGYGVEKPIRSCL